MCTTDSETRFASKRIESRKAKKKRQTAKYNKRNHQIPTTSFQILKERTPSLSLKPS